ncbi:hypothetical protein LR48_Vigan09g169300 [Vigna angularis]|uniref:Uncharacterized protein n=1 Tax=Phaseolus angularis TaxID=3914 RepID=A0A0L9VEE3_PHAAN|nr:hypothetical protein LR48_Vigan09g169300 [Vigna angularis]
MLFVDRLVPPLLLVESLASMKKNTKIHVRRGRNPWSEMLLVVGHAPVKSIFISASEFFQLKSIFISVSEFLYLSFFSLVVVICNLWVVIWTLVSS